MLQYIWGIYCRGFVQVRSSSRSFRPRLFPTLISPPPPCFTSGNWNSRTPSKPSPNKPLPVIHFLPKLKQVENEGGGFPSSSRNTFPPPFVPQSDKKEFPLYQLKSCWICGASLPLLQSQQVPFSPPPAIFLGCSAADVFRYREFFPLFVLSCNFSLGKERKGRGGKKKKSFSCWAAEET